MNFLFILLSIFIFSSYSLAANLYEFQDSRTEPHLTILPEGAEEIEIYSPSISFKLNGKYYALKTGSYVDDMNCISSIGEVNEYVEIPGSENIKHRIYASTIKFPNISINDALQSCTSILRSDKKFQAVYPGYGCDYIAAIDEEL